MLGIDSINNPTLENISNLKKCLIIKTPKRFLWNVAKGWHFGVVK